MHIYLMGYRGSGKTTVGRLLAARLQLPFVDTDQVIESAAGKTIREIFAEEGEPGFRNREQHALASVAAETANSVVSLGGGAILREANQSIIQSSGRVVWLHGSPEALFARIESDLATAQRRPQLTNLSGCDEVVDILAKREPIYRKLAEKTVLTDLRSPDDLVAEIADWVNSFGQQVFAE